MKLTSTLVMKGKIDGDKVTLAAGDEGRTAISTADRITNEMNMVHSGQTAKAEDRRDAGEVALHCPRTRLPG